jgi:UDP-N-acetylmuramate--alanine ligase
MKDVVEGQAPIHIVGIGGIGMSAIAEVLHDRGVAVRGSDMKDGANVRRLAAKGIPVTLGHVPENIEGASQVVLSSAVKADNPEVIAAKSAGLPLFSRAESLASLMADMHNVCVTGSHGKTTTTSMVAWIFEKAGLDPTVITGGIINSWGTNARIGRGAWMVVEADESDATFIKLPTTIGIVTNIDPEHLDYYQSLDALHDAFRAFFAQIQPGGLAVAGIDHPVVRAMVEAAPYMDGRRLLTYGKAADADLRLLDVRSHGGTLEFDAELSDRVNGRARRLTNVKLLLPGHYNALNALAAMAVAAEAGIDEAVVLDALASFEGVKRRFTRTGVWNGVAIYDDYAHHPAEVCAVLKAARGATSGRVIAIAQPHRYSRLKNLFHEFCACFAECDTLIVAPVYTAGEKPNGVDSHTLAEGVRALGNAPRVLEIDGEEALPALIASLAKPGDLVIGLGAGTITEWANALPHRLAALQPALDAAE